MNRCPQCNAITKGGGHRCKLVTCKFAPKCYHHTAVQVGQSNIPGAGRGLFARRTIKQGETIANYTLGTQPLTQQMFDMRYPDGRATHVAQIHGTYYDASNSAKSIAGMANRATSGSRNNAKINQNGGVVTTRQVRKGQEIYLSYGRSYRL